MAEYSPSRVVEALMRLPRLSAAERAVLMAVANLEAVGLARAGTEVLGKMVGMHTISAGRVRRSLMLAGLLNCELEYGRRFSVSVNWERIVEAIEADERLAAEAELATAASQRAA